MRKKGALQLGINTIVVLVIAMVLIAGGITFIQGFLGNATAVLDPYFNPEDYPRQGTSSEPVVFAQTSELKIKSGEQITVPIGLYNTLGVEKNFSLNFSDCASGEDIPEGETVQPVPIVIVGDIVLPPGKATVKKIFVKAKYINKNGEETDLSAGNYICNLKVIEDEDATVILGQKDAIVEVTS